MSRWVLIPLVVLFVLLIAAPTSSPAPAQTPTPTPNYKDPIPPPLIPRAYFPVAAKSYLAPTPTPRYLLDIFVYPEEPYVYGDIFVVAFGNGTPCGVLQNRSLTVTATNKHILITAELRRWEGGCIPPGAEHDWGILEHVYLGWPYAWGLPEPGEWTAEIRLTTPENEIETMSVTFNVVSHSQ